MRLRFAWILAFAMVAACGARTSLRVVGRDSGAPTLDVPSSRPDANPMTADVPPSTPDATIPPPPDDGGMLGPGTNSVDMLFVIDNSGSMIEVQRLLLLKFETLLQALRVPLCGSRSNPDARPHACDANNVDDVPLNRPLLDMHVGVVSTDLGTPGSMIPGCDDASRGDHGLLNPIRNGFALQSHIPWAPRRPNAVTAPAGFRPPVCTTDINQFPNFITFCSNTADASCDRPERFASTRDDSTFSDWFKCNAGIFINGCGLEQPLEAAWRALLVHDARARPGNMSPNAGFIRDDALLAIIVISDEEDGSVRNCEYDQGFSSQSGQPCDSALDVYNTSSAAWAHPTNPDLRFYLYTPGDRRDPTWNLDRYVNTAPRTASNRWNNDFLSLKPGRPDRVLFGAITGVPLTLPTRGGVVDYDALLGRPGPDRDNFLQRDASTAISGTQGAAGPFSMRQANMDPACSHVVPACRRAGSTYNPTMSCSNSQYMAFPSRRITEVARRFEESPLCNGAPCRNGYVTSICTTSLDAALVEIGAKLARRMTE
ncbi:MAG: hypothetical protein JNK05_11090 [Myxococcales bacterium]|nr:hypothetical protein [Myxococcales bacterium]